MRPPQSSVQVQADLDEGKAAVAASQNLRAAHRGKSAKGGDLRAEAFGQSLVRLKKASLPVRRYIGMLPSHPELRAFDLELRAVSKALHSERRKLRKMLR